MVGLLAACTTSAGSGAEFQVDMESMILPLDAYAIDVVVSDYSENILVKKCFEEHGFHGKQIPRVDVSRPSPVTETPLGRRVLTPAIAEELGYSRAPDLRFDPEQVKQVHAQEFTPAEQKQWDECIDAARTELPSMTDSLNYVAVLAGSAFDEAAKDEDVVDAVTRWRECMRPEGFAGLPDMPEQMPGAVSEAGDSVDAHALAVADATCRDSSGYRETLFETVLPIQERLIEENADTLERIAAEFDAARAKQLEIIRTHGGDA